MNRSTLHLKTLPWIGAMALTLAACSSTTQSSTDGDDAGTGSGNATDDAGADGAANVPDRCESPPRRSKCANEASWVRGIAHFDPSHFGADAKPVLRMILRHAFVLYPGEDKIGGRLHSFDGIPILEPEKGEIQFAVDMCGLGTAMWSEENSTFHLVLIIDENGNNNIGNALTGDEAIQMATPDEGELVKMVDVDVSCHGASPCLDVNIDCVGPACTVIEPIKSCRKKDPGCDSDSTFCQ